MMKIMMWSRVILILIVSWKCLEKSWALPVDEKLPLRVLKTSDSKKTILINRGIEDGLVKGDHAKFFLTTGVVGRGVLVEASPSRSVWSLYRIVSEPDLAPDKVMNLKISAPVKLTKDVSKMFTGDEAPEGPPQGITLAEGADDVDKSLTADEKGELKKVDSNGAQVQDDILSYRTLELWGMFHLSSLSSNNSTGATAQGTSGYDRNFNLLVGFEKYFLDYNSWYGKFSLFPFFHYANQDYTSIEGHSLSSELMALGVGFDWHFGAPPLAVERFIFFVGPTIGLGKSKDATALYKVTSSYPELVGSASFFSVGGGVKYFMSRGFGLRIILDYYKRIEVYKVEGSKDDYIKNISGPRILLGLSYRF